MMIDGRVARALRVLLLGALLLACSEPTATEDGGRLDAQPADSAGLDGTVPSDTGCAPADYGSCTRPGRCEQYLGSFWATYDLLEACPDGELSECGCSTAGLIGRCVRAEGLANEYENYYYEGDPAALEADCDGTWTDVPRPDSGMIDGGSPDTGMADAGPPADAGATCAPGTVMLASSCSFSACGGAVTAPSTFCYDSVCIPYSDVLGSITGLVCSGTTTITITGSAVGSIELLGTDVAGDLMRDVTTSFSGTVSLAEGFCSSDGACAMVESAMNGRLGAFGSATCTNRTATGCDCAVTYSRRHMSSGSYTVSGSTFDITGAPYDFCQTPAGGTTLQIRDTRSPMQEWGVATISPL